MRRGVVASAGLSRVAPAWLAAGGDSTVCADANGGLWAVGYNEDGQGGEGCGGWDAGAGAGGGGGAVGKLLLLLMMMMLMLIMLLPAAAACSCCC